MHGQNHIKFDNFWLIYIAIFFRGNQKGNYK